MPLNTFTLGLTIGDLPEFCGPDDLSEAIVSIRESELERYDGDNKWLSPISNDGIRRLITLAYYTSFAAEEGRYPRFRLISANYNADSIRYATSFETQISDVESLRRLAPAVSETDGALLVTERDGVLLCIGSVILGDMGYGTKIGRPEIGGVGRSPSLVVRVDHPGCLRATEFFTLVLDGGRIQQVVPYNLVPQTQELWRHLAAQMVDSTASIYGEESRAFFGGTHTLAQVIHKAWSRVLATTIDKQHGGAFVILPTEGKPKNFDIHCKYPAQMRFREDILQFWQSCVSCAIARDDRERAIDNWSRRRAIVFSKAEILAGLSSVDGCVVLDQHLRVLGFGGEIRVDEKMVKAAPRALRNIKTGQPMEDELKQMGTRHRSACRLAQVHPGIIVFVISQDGDLRIFCSDESNVFGFDRLHAWVHQYESE
jgi:hypothetical protein